MCIQTVCNGFQPFCNIGVLKYDAFPFALALSCRNFEVLKAVTGGCVGLFVIQNSPLVRDDGVRDQTDILIPVGIIDFNVFCSTASLHTQHTCKKFKTAAFQNHWDYNGRPYGF